MKKYFVFTKCRGFANLYDVEDYFNKDINEVFRHRLYNTKSQAAKNCSNICDGESDIVVGIEAIDKWKNTVHNCYNIAIDTPLAKKEFYERHIIFVTEEKLASIFEGYEKLFTSKISNKK